MAADKSVDRKHHDEDADADGDDDDDDDFCDPEYTFSGDYYIRDLLEWYNGRHFRSREQAIKQTCRRLGCCYRMIPTAHGMMAILKISPAEPFSISARIPAYPFFCRYPGCPKNGVRLNQIITDELKSFMSQEIIFQPYHIDAPPSRDPMRFNVFPGFRARIDTETPWENLYRMALPIFNHIRYVLANNNQRHYKWILSWFAHPIIKLTRTQSVLVLLGAQGSGKDTIHDFFRDFVYGPNLCLQYDDFATTFKSDFNGELSGKMMVHISEKAGG